MCHVLLMGTSWPCLRQEAPTWWNPPHASFHICGAVTLACEKLSAPLYSIISLSATVVTPWAVDSSRTCHIFSELQIHFCLHTGVFAQFLPWLFFQQVNSIGSLLGTRPLWILPSLLPFDRPQLPLAQGLQHDTSSPVVRSFLLTTRRTSTRPF